MEVSIRVFQWYSLGSLGIHPGWQGVDIVVQDASGLTGERLLRSASIRYGIQVKKPR